MNASQTVLTFKSGVEVRFSAPLDPNIARAFTALSDGTEKMNQALVAWANDSALFLAHHTDVLPNMVARPELKEFKASAGVQTEFGFDQESRPCRRMVFLMQGTNAGVRGWGDPNGGLFFAFYRMTPEQWLRFCSVLKIDPQNPKKHESSALRIHLELDADSFSKFGPGIGF